MNGKTTVDEKDARTDHIQKAFKSVNLTAHQRKIVEDISKKYPKLFRAVGKL